MSLGFYTDAALTRLISLSKLKRFCFPSNGGTKSSVVYLGDPFYTLLSAPVFAGASSVVLNDTSQFLNSGSAVINGVVFTYTGKTLNSLTGCVGVPQATELSQVRPNILYSSVGNISIVPTGAGFSQQFTLQLGAGASGGFGFPQGPAIYTQSSITSGQSLALSIQITMQAGPDVELSDWLLTTSAFTVQDALSGTVEDGYQTVNMFGYVYRGTQSPTLNQRVIQLNRQITNLNPGFVVGKYRWRPSKVNAGYAFIPPNWNLDPVNTGIAKFQSGIGYDTDLAMVDLVNENTSIYPYITPGQYFYKPFRNYLQSSTQVDVLSGPSLIQKLTQVPTRQTPVQVGVWTFDSSNTYTPYLTYTQIASTLNEDGSSRTDLPANYFLIDRRTGLITLSSIPGNKTAYLGQLTATQTQFELPFYPMDEVTAVYCDYGGARPRAYATSVSVDTDARRITVTIPGGNTGDSVYVDFPVKVAVIYDIGAEGSDRLETSVDLNPAYAGISTGHYYIEQRIRRTASITLSCDKPVIDIPATYSTVVDLVAYGPVYLKGDYALLTAQAFTSIGGEIMPNARLLVVPGENFTGLINYQDPTKTQVVLVTGGDGKVNAVYTPQGAGGYYIPNQPASGPLAGVATTTVANDTLVLPEGIPISQVWDSSEGWTIYTYTVADNEPFYGQINANPQLGQIPYATTGTIGTADWTTNGSVIIWQNGSTNVYPINALDQLGNSYTSSEFNGLVTQLVYATSLPTSVDYPAYYVNYLQRVLIKVQDMDTGIYSNSILLQLQYPAIVNDDPWLYLNNSDDGIINQYRLGWVKPGE